MIRSAIVVIVGIPLTAVLGGWIVLSALLRLPGTRTCCEVFPRFWSRVLLFLAGVRVEMDGMESVDWSRPTVVVANHQSWFDVFALAAYLPARYRFVAKQELARIPIFGKAWRSCGHIAVNRSDRSQAVASIEEAGTEIRDRRLAVIFFPEGTRSPDGRLQEFKKGAFVLAIQTGVPVVPLGISGSHAVMPKGSFRIRSGTIRIRVGEPIPVSGLSMSERDGLLREGRARVAALMEEPAEATRPPEEEEGKEDPAGTGDPGGGEFLEHRPED
jgi:1-acyl-sn-glycerol-3-phosphate acyltransferase